MHTESAMMDTSRDTLSTRLRHRQSETSGRLPLASSSNCWSSLDDTRLQHLSPPQAASFDLFNQLLDPEPVLGDYSQASSSAGSTPGSHVSATSSPEYAKYQSSDEKKPAARSRENNYHDALLSGLNRRRAQNRASQRAYRQRKEQRIRDLEQLLQESEKREAALIHSFFFLQEKHRQLCIEKMEKSQGGVSFPVQDMSHLDPAPGPEWPIM
ncbi:hypothetical protein C2857_007574 [Epichloe festucae Fl1]|uniref:Putative transcription factor kapC n=1 Tax=Epichloe festucae (strain Fl1) TaxID=877507 RepID=A0A7S9KQW1_EPIFF|nr:hypothetical protein C2857_007574 [Epichloe festucae Fl1]